MRVLAAREVAFGIGIASFIACIAFTSPAMAKQRLPNQPAIAQEDANGTRTLVGWKRASATAKGMKDRQTPANPAFSGAEVFHFTVNTRHSDAAALTAFEKAGMSGPQLIAKTALLPAAVDVLDAHPDAHGQVVVVDGQLNGKPARGIALSLYGSVTGEDRKSGVHAFMAPLEPFKALGGFSIVAANWFNASARPGEDMRIEGSLAPQAATNRCALFFNKWIESYVIPMMGLTLQMQMKSIEQMSTWNNAMSACAGDASCTLTQDGSGNWSATRQ